MVLVAVSSLLLVGVFIVVGGVGWCHHCLRVVSCGSAFFVTTVPFIMAPFFKQLFVSLQRIITEKEEELDRRKSQVLEQEREVIK